MDWDALINDYSRIRDLIADTIPGFTDFNVKLSKPGGFHLPNPAASRTWKTPDQKAGFAANSLPGELLSAQLPEGVTPDLILQTLRSHDQYNTTVYGLDDRYRGVFGQRYVVFVNAGDIARLGFSDGDKVDMVSLWHDGRERRVNGFTLVAYDIPPGQAAAYFPEANGLVPLESYGDGSFTPTSKYIAIKLTKAQADNRIPITQG